MSHFDRSSYFGWSDRNAPFHWTKLLFPVPLKILYPAYNENNQMQSGLGWVSGLAGGGGGGDSHIKVMGMLTLSETKICNFHS